MAGLLSSALGVAHAAEKTTEMDGTSADMWGSGKAAGTDEDRGE